ncbi:hypothetical protein C2857_002804 [Epichloe festucae Fl1]|uniref:Uncharacterized protein n=1 Tax=Epichloe festucae (strain Fl1) TaxID=877507 RepID=A0A7U3Q091_EPIFF|nr:hypothetical protein C2857_002804 [Epichloe festucae Fl1]
MPRCASMEYAWLPASSFVAGNGLLLYWKCDQHDDDDDDDDDDYDDGGGNAWPFGCSDGRRRVDLISRLFDPVVTRPLHTGNWKQPQSAITTITTTATTATTAI